MGHLLSCWPDDEKGAWSIAHAKHENSPGGESRKFGPVKIFCYTVLGAEGGTNLELGCL